MNLTLGEGVQLNIRVKARGTINQVKGGPSGNSVNVILLLSLDLILY